MHTHLSLSLAALCLGITLTGTVLVIASPADRRERMSLALVYVAFALVVSIPLISVFAAELYVFYLPLILVMLLILPPAVYHYVLAKAGQHPLAGIPLRDVMLPILAGAVCIGFWLLPARTKAALFISGTLPPGTMPAVLALATFVLILCWLAASTGYMLASVRQLRRHRARIRQQFSNLDKRDLRWIDWMMALLVTLWAVTAVSLAADNFGGGPLVPAWVLYGLTGYYLVFLTVFATAAPPAAEPAEPSAQREEKYARSALSSEHGAKLATRIETAMRRDTLYLDPNLSLQKLSRHVGAAPNLVSQTLNEVIGSSFFDYVAHWRVAASKPLLLTSDASVLTIAFDVGFNSRSTFYKAFKRETGLTPKAFRSLPRSQAE